MKKQQDVEASVGPTPDQIDAIVQWRKWAIEQAIKAEAGDHPDKLVAAADFLLRYIGFGVENAQHPLP